MTNDLKAAALRLRERLRRAVNKKLYDNPDRHAFTVGQFRQWVLDIIFREIQPVVDADRAKIEWLKQAFITFGNHWPGCIQIEGRSCSCGYDKICAALGEEE